MYDILIAPFADYVFMRKALIGALAVALGAAPIGAFLILRRMSLTGDAIAHGILPGAAVGYLLAGLSLTAMTFGGLVAGMAVALGAAAVSRRTTQREDASLAAFTLISLAAGVMLVSLRGSNLDLLHFLFGSVLALPDDALILLAAIATVSLLTFAFLFRLLVADALDPAFLRRVAKGSGVVHYVFLALAVLNLVAGFHALGTLMAVGIMILPAAAARFWTRSVGAIVVVAVVIAALSCVTGLLLAFHLDLPPSPTMILCSGVAYLVSLLVGREGSVMTRRRLPAGVPA
ncbi:MAG: metal ABC transporter permease [Bauldia sp.]|nr:metal ABC transporter permease [Bauldia sp.]